MENKIIKVVLATGITQLDEQIQKRVQDDSIQFVGTALYKEAVEDVLQRCEPDVLLLSETLDGPLSSRELILKLRINFPDTRIIYFLKEDDPTERSFLYHYSVFDIFVNKFNPTDFKNALYNPKKFKDIRKEMADIGGYETFDNSEQSYIDRFTTIHKSEGGKLHAPAQTGETLYQQVVGFWSVLDQAGKTSSAVNTSLMLSSNPQLKVLLLDFSITNPNVHLQFGFSDPERNLGAIIEDYQQGAEITKANLKKYLITHNSHKNLNILPGILLKMERPSETLLMEIFDDILDAAQQNNYSTILVDMDSGVRDQFSAHILKKVNKIFLHIAETPGSIYGISRCLDKEFGPFSQHLIDRKKILPIITRSHDNTFLNFRRHVEKTLETGVRAKIDENEEFRMSLFKALPILQKQPPEEIYDSFIFISNLVHNIFKNPIKRKPMNAPATNQTVEKKGLLGNLFAGSPGESKKEKGKGSKKPTKK